METVEYEIEITLAIAGGMAHEEIVERLFESFHRANPDAEAVVGVQPGGLIELSYAVEAANPNEAFELGRPIFASGVASSGLPVESIDPIDLFVRRVTSNDGTPAVARELQPA